MNAEPITMPHAPLVEERAPHESPRDDARPFESFADRLLRPAADGEAIAEGGKRLATGLGLATLFGGALGLRAGGASIALHAAGAAAGLLAVAGVAVPAFAIVLALADAPIDARALTGATSRGVAKAGLLLGGLAPATALYVVTVEDAITVTVVGLGALLLAGAVAAGSFAADLRAPLAAASNRTRALVGLAMPAFLAFAAVLALRVWWLTLPVLSLAAGAR
jgi:hypothetical protein